MKNIINLGIFVILLLLLTGCWAPKCTLTTANITQPVLVGKVKTIKGEPIENSNLDNGNKFSATIKNSIFYYSTVYFYGYNNVIQGSNLLDKQLLPITNDISKDADGKIIADQIRFNSGSGYWLVAMYSVNQGWIEGKKYSLKLNELKK